MPPGRHARAGRWPGLREPRSRPPASGGPPGHTRSYPHDGAGSTGLSHPTASTPAPSARDPAAVREAAQKLHCRPLPRLCKPAPPTARRKSVPPPPPPCTPEVRPPPEGRELRRRHAASRLRGSGGVVDAPAAGEPLLPLLLPGLALLPAGSQRGPAGAQQWKAVRTILYAFLEKVQRTPHKPFVLFRDETLTTRRWTDATAKWLGRCATLPRPAAGDCVAIFMGNEPAYICLWLGLIKLGCAMACLNYNIPRKVPVALLSVLWGRRFYWSHQVSLGTTSPWH